LAEKTILAPTAGGHERLGGIEALRAYAAGAIVIFHLIHLGGVEPPHALEFMKWFFGFGVPLFFVVSAFSLTYGYEDRLSGRRDVAVFYVRRFFRIAPLYYLMFAFTLPQAGFLPLRGENGLIVASSLVFAFNLFPSAVDGVVPGSWSIGVEMLFYLVLPALLPLVRSIRAAGVFTVVSVVLAIAYALQVHAHPDLPAAMIQHGFLFNLPYFGFGLVAAKVYRRVSPAWGKPALILGALGLLALYGLARAMPEAIAAPAGNAAFQMLWGAPFALVCLGVALAPVGLISNPATRFLGLISYSLYLAHPHLVHMLQSRGVYAAIGGLGGGAGLRFALAAALTFALLVPISWLLFKLVEAPGMRLGRRVCASAILQRRAPGPAAAE
jgi:peptidoglycan/LPS O-acetylase OafA/YrhL